MKIIVIKIDTDNQSDIEHLETVLKYVLGLSPFTYTVTGAEA